MNKYKRILIECLLPPVAAGLLIGIYLVCTFRSEFFPFLQIYLTVIGIFGTLLGVIYALAMEMAFALGLDPRGRKVTVTSCAFGLLAGITMLVLGSAGSFSDLSLHELGIFPVTGCVVGYIVGTVVRTLETKHACRLA